MLGVEAGFLTLGGVDTRLHTSPMVYAENLRESGWYTININNVYIREGGGLSAAPNSDDQVVHKVNSPKDFGKNAIVDSGTTDTYLNKRLSQPFAEGKFVRIFIHNLAFRTDVNCISSCSQLSLEKGRRKGLQ